MNPLTEGLRLMTQETVGRPMEILLVEDDLDDAGLTIEALSQKDIPCRVSLVRDGEEALEFLRQQGRFARAPRPDLILMDMNLPRLGGREVLAEIENDGVLGAVPIVVLTASDAHREILQSQRLHVEDYLTKPVDFEQFTAVVKSLRRYLLADVILPT